MGREYIPLEPRSQRAAQRLEANAMWDYLLIPDHDDEDETYPGGIEPGYYTINEVVSLLRKHKDNPEAIQFIADMLEL